MTFSVVALIIEILLFAAGAYLYLFARGAFKPKDPEVAARAEKVREENGTWMRIGGLALAAIMLVNIIAHLTEFF